MRRMIKASFGTAVWHLPRPPKTQAAMTGAGLLNLTNAAANAKGGLVGRKPGKRRVLARRFDR